ncbi:MAG: hypothetical protein HOB99_10050 [Candidatus Marinimicrobia bacterium]|jgi:hypothetical protein|nr:hypothetical protein [Candidatus Neomarinimicrobiota bacterium]
MSKKDSTKTSLNFDLSQLSPAEKRLEKRLLELSKTTKVRPTLVSQKQSPSSYQFVEGRKEQ